MVGGSAQRNESREYREATGNSNKRKQLAISRNEAP